MSPILSCPRNEEFLCDSLNGAARRTSISCACAFRLGSLNTISERETNISHYSPNITPSVEVCGNQCYKDIINTNSLCNVKSFSHVYCKCLDPSSSIITFGQ